jgi:hypothetical protein
MMKKILFSIVLLFTAHSIFAQISNFPAAESFDATFTEGTDVAFIPNWTGNTVATANRIFRDEVDFNSAPSAMSVIPTSAFTADVRVALNLSAYQSVGISFLAKSMLNGAGTRAVVLNMQTSIDGGITWIGNQNIASLPNENQTAFTSFSYILPSEANNQSNVIVRFLVTRSTAGIASAAKLVIDDVAIAVNTTPVVLIDQNAFVFSQVFGLPSQSQVINVSGINLIGDLNITASTDFEISLSPNSGYTNSLVVTPSAGAVATTGIFVRMNKPTVGTSTGTLTIATPSVVNTIAALSGENFGVTVTNPIPYTVLNLDNHTFLSQWDAATTAGSFPDNMVFWTHNTANPDLSTPFIEDWNCLYNLTSRSRFTGEGDNGIGFINTGNSQFTGVCDGTDPTQNTGDVIGNGKAGAVVLSLDTSLGNTLCIRWTARTILKNVRVYGLRMQYRVGDSNGNPNAGWSEFPTTQEYISGEDNTFEDKITNLPADCLGQPLVQIRWVYYYISGTGARPKMALDEVSVYDLLLGNPEFNTNTDFGFYPNPVNGNSIYFNVPADVVVSDATGKQVISAKNVTQLDVTNLLSGIYFIKNQDGKVLKMIK